MKIKNKLGWCAFNHHQELSFTLHRICAMDDYLFWKIHKLLSFQIMQVQADQITRKYWWISFLKRCTLSNWMASMPMSDGSTLEIPNHFKIVGHILPKRSYSMNKWLIVSCFPHPHSISNTLNESNCHAKGETLEALFYSILCQWQEKECDALWKSFDYILLWQCSREFDQISKLKCLLLNSAKQYYPTKNNT